MPSAALTWWQGPAPGAFAEIEAARAAIGGTGPGRRYATGQLNNAYTVLISSAFQRFCRDLHTEAADHLSSLAPASIRVAVLLRMTDARKLDQANPNPGNLGSDFNRLGLKFWPAVQATDASNAGHQSSLETLNEWRNAIAHQDFNKPACAGRTATTLGQARQWRRACDALALSFDGVLHSYLTGLSGVPPW